MDDSLGREVNLIVWSYLGNDVIGMVVRFEKIVNVVEKVWFIKKWEILIKVNLLFLEEK